MVDGWKNKLYFGDNLDILRENIPIETVDLIYLDSPFNSNATYNVLFAEQSGEKSAAREANRGLWAPETCDGNTDAPTDPSSSTPTASSTSQPTIAPSATPKPATLTFTLTTKPTGGGVPPISKDDCPSSHPIKGNQGSRSTTDWIYHVPGSHSYAVTDPEECFSTEADAVSAGYRAPRR